MIVAGDVPVWMRDGSLTYLSQWQDGMQSHFGALDVSEIHPGDEKFVLLGTESLGKIIISSKYQYYLSDVIKLHVSLRSGDAKLPPRIWKHLDHMHDLLLHEKYTEAYAYVSNLLSMAVYLDELSTQELERLWKKFHIIFSRLALSKKNNNLMLFKGTDSLLVSRLVQKVGWKLGYHSQFLYKSGAIMLKLLSNPEYTIIDYDNNQILDIVTDLRLYKLDKNIKIYSVYCKNIPLISTTTGVFRCI